MKRKSKKALLFTALGGSIFSCSFAPSYGMENEMFHAKEEKNQRAICRSFYRNCKNNEEVLFLPCIERKMKQKKQEEFFKFSPHVELPLSQQEDYQTIDFWLSDAEKGNLAALYNVGWLLQQLREKDSFSLMMDEERKNTPPQKEGNSILEKASAFYWLVKANNQEDSEAWYELGMIYARAQSAEKNYEKALEYFQKAAKHNYAAAQRAIGWFYAAGLGVSQDYVEAMKWLQKAAEQNDAWAQYMIGCLYYQGLGVEQDNIEAMKWFYKVPAKLRGDEFSACSFTNKNVRQINLTNLYYSSFEVRQNKKKTLRDYRKSIDELFKRAKNDEAIAQRKIGLYYLEGIAVAKNEETSFKWLMKAAEQNDSIAQTMIGIKISESKQFSQEEAFNWIMKAAKQDLLFAQVIIGAAYIGAWAGGVKQNPLIALEWLQKATEKQDSTACFLMGRLYLEFGKNKDIALKWFLKGAHMGLAEAQYEVSRLLLKKLERGAITDEKQAKTMGREASMWLRKAALQEHRVAKAALELAPLKNDLLRLIFYGFWYVEEERLESDEEES